MSWAELLRLRGLLCSVFAMTVKPSCIKLLSSDFCCIINLTLFDEKVIFVLRFYFAVKIGEVTKWANSWHCHYSPNKKVVGFFYKSLGLSLWYFTDISRLYLTFNPIPPTTLIAGHVAIDN